MDEKGDVGWWNRVLAQLEAGAGRLTAVPRSLALHALALSLDEKLATLVDVVVTRSEGAEVALQVLAIVKSEAVLSRALSALGDLATPADVLVPWWDVARASVTENSLSRLERHLASTPPGRRYLIAGVIVRALHGDDGSEDAAQLLQRLRAHEDADVRSVVEGAFGSSGESD